MRILAMFSAAFAAAAALCAYALPAAWGWLPGLCLAALAAALLLLHGDPVRRVRTIALGLAAGFLWCWAADTRSACRWPAARASRSSRRRPP